MSERVQCVKYNGTLSNEMSITHGVPQGSILGPLLFLLYINDISAVSSLIDFVLYADDSNFLLSGPNLKVLVETINIELTKAVEWFTVNK
jgi:retron-type reverse transcriptase